LPFQAAIPATVVMFLCINDLMILKCLDLALDSSSMWVDKYKPANLTEIIGCQDIVKKLSDWLIKWDSVILFYSILTISSHY
jgi:hypothetical protein